MNGYENEEGDPALLRGETTSAVATRAPANGTQTDGFGTRAITTSTEIGSTALAAQATAAVQARCIMAMRNPRNIDQVRLDILGECKRRGFAEAARYSMPRGNCQECKGRKKLNGQDCWKCEGSGKNLVKGWTIRFAEAALRAFKNALVETVVLADEPLKRTTRQVVTDLESNLTYSLDFVTEKTIERKFLKDGQKPLSVRMNSYNEQVYLVPATEEDLRSKVGINTSKAMRDNALRMIPGDIKDDALDQVYATLNTEVADPRAARKKIVDAFAGVGVKPADLAAYLEHDIESCTPAEMQTLREFFSAIKDGQTTWREIMDAGGDEGEKKPAQAPKSGTAGVKEKLAAAQAAKSEAGGVQSGTTATSGANVASTSASAPDAPPATSPVPKSSLTPETLKVLEARVASLFGPTAEVAREVDAALGGAGIDSIDQVSEKFAREAIAIFDQHILEKKRKK